MIMEYVFYLLIFKTYFMLIEISSLDNGSGLNSNLDVYACYNDKQRLFDQRPFCRIDEGELCELLTDKQIDKMYAGVIHFNLNKQKLIDSANKVYNKY